ncbi:hypothetical protein [Ectopseudomonas alcaliphila]|uniref:hypothetical protein n=1 Tax=Ectopseudomonas alcaliphila TaxID=101564 RepID=UPI002782871B|nr:MULTISPECIES: hypothetical protein [Pseudomonas]MDP9942727.1 hypothetical protein [Pseudomonas sp. 3400]MDR7014935.1 hypothetical protein [Pseudomonas alcaliphila]
MIGINTYTALGTTRPSNASGQVPVQAQDDKAAASQSREAVGVSSTTDSVSNLAQKLSQAAKHAQDRDASYTREELSAHADKMLQAIIKSDDNANADDVTANIDAVQADRIDQSTRFLEGSDSNPFEGLSRDQLALVVYDDSGAFTVNERRAALNEARVQEDAWAQKTLALSKGEKGLPSDLASMLGQALDHFNGLPAIEQSRYPADYVSSIQHTADDADESSGQRGKQDVSPAEQALPYLAAGKYTLSQQSDDSANIASTTNPVERKANASAQAGYDLMVSRLWSGREPSVANGADGMSASNIGRNRLDFLTKEDRAVLAEMYSYAQSEGADLNYVDRIAGVLGRYRQHNDGQVGVSFNSGHHFDTEGHQLSVGFNERDTATASRILNGSAINSTKLDQGFLRYMLDPGYGALSHTTDFEFLEHMVNKFSNEGDFQPPLDGRFATYNPVTRIADNIVITASQDVKIEPFKPDIENVNGVWTITEKGKAAGVTLDQLTGESKKLPSLDIPQFNQNRYILDAIFGKSEAGGSRPEWLVSLLDRLNR